MRYRYQYRRLENSRRAGLLLIAIFGVSASAGIMAAHQVPTPHMIRQETPNRHPDSHSPPTVSPNRDVVVAVIDTGFDMNHPDLNRHVWVNSGESGVDANGHDKSTNGIDDDGNGYIDDVHGFDFVERKSRIEDKHGHGTHIAGIVVRTAPRARIMNLKYFSHGLDGPAALRSSLEAMRYAIAMKVDIINYSGGGTVASREELRILREANRQGILVVAAAGNEATNSERHPFYPANYHLSNILSVTAVDETASRLEILPTSNFGIQSVAVAARGKDVRSALPGGQHGTMTGTSQATAFATGAAVRLIASDLRERRKTSPEELIERLLASSSMEEVLIGKTRLGSTLSAERAARFRRAASSDEAERIQFVRALGANLK